MLGEESTVKDVSLNDLYDEDLEIEGKPKYDPESLEIDFKEIPMECFQFKHPLDVNKYTDDPVEDSQLTTDLIMEIN